MTETVYYEWELRRCSDRQALMRVCVPEDQSFQWTAYGDFGLVQWWRRKAGRKRWLKVGAPFDFLSMRRM